MLGLLTSISPSKSLSLSRSIILVISLASLIIGVAVLRIIIRFGTLLKNNFKNSYTSIPSLLAVAVKFKILWISSAQIQVCSYFFAILCHESSFSTTLLFTSTPNSLTISFLKRLYVLVNIPTLLSAIVILFFFSFGEGFDKIVSSKNLPPVYLKTICDLNSSRSPRLVEITKNPDTLPSKSFRNLKS